MSRFTRSLCLPFIIGVALTLSCGSSDEDGTGGSSVSETGGSSNGGTGGTAGSGGDAGTGGAGGSAGTSGMGGDAGVAGTSGSGGVAQDAGPDGAAGTGGASDAGLDAAPDATMQEHLVLVFDHAWSWTEVEQDTVTASCWHVDDSGVKQPDPGDLVISSPAPAVPVSSGVFTFPDAGVYDITCSSASLNLSTTEPAIVTYEGFDYRYVEAIQVVSESRRWLETIVAANQADDPSTYATAVDELESLAAKIPDLGSVPLLVDNPNGWPTDQDLTDAGLTAGPDDAAWVTALGELRAALVAERTALQNLTDPPNGTQAQALIAAYSATKARLQTLKALSPSEVAVWKNLAEVGSLVAEMAETSRTRFTKLAVLFRGEPPLGSGSTSLSSHGNLRFSLLGTLASIAIQETLGAYTYSSVLKNVGKVVVANMISMAIKDLLNSGFVPGAHAPVLDSVHGSAAGFVVPGNGFQTLGSFNSDPAKTRIVFIPPTIANELSTIVDFVDGINGLTQEGNVLKLINGVRKLMDNLVTLFGAASSAGEQAIVLTPDGGDDFIVSYPPLPYGINCSQYGLPVAGTMIPVDLDYGRGLAINVNVIGEPAGNCQ